MKLNIPKDLADIIANKAESIRELEVYLMHYRYAGKVY